MIVKRNEGNSGNITITLECLNPNYASRAEIHVMMSSPHPIPGNQQGQKNLVDGVATWALPNNDYDLFLNVAADLVEGAEPGKVRFRATITQNGSNIPPWKNSNNPQTNMATAFQGDTEIKKTTFVVTIL